MKGKIVRNINSSKPSRINNPKPGIFAKCICRRDELECSFLGLEEHRGGWWHLMPAEMEDPVQGSLWKAGSLCSNLPVCTSSPTLKNWKKFSWPKLSGEIVDKIIPLQEFLMQYLQCNIYKISLHLILIIPCEIIKCVST